MPIHGLGSLKRPPQQRVPELWLTAGGSTRGWQAVLTLADEGQGWEPGPPSLGFLRAWGSLGAGALGAGRPPPAWPGRRGGHPAGLRGAGPAGPQGWGWARPPPSPGFCLRGGGRGSAFFAPRMPRSACQGRPRFPSAAQLAHEPREQQRGHQAPTGPQWCPQSAGPPLREHGVLHQAHLCHLRGPLLRWASEGGAGRGCRTTPGGAGLQDPCWCWGGGWQEPGLASEGPPELPAAHPGHLSSSKSRRWWPGSGAGGSSGDAGQGAAVLCPGPRAPCTPPPRTQQPRWQAG